MQADILMQAALVALEGQQVIAAFIGNFLGDGFLPTGHKWQPTSAPCGYRVNGDNGAADIQPFQ